MIGCASTGNFADSTTQPPLRHGPLGEGVYWIVAAGVLFGAGLVALSFSHSLSIALLVALVLGFL